ncbi:hypothetical protein AX16_007386 [Volvariella volvacea WC 439]|nr:hypothetical protein AX16_007386 [Volvariella volvacea WC 439]
MRPFSNFVSLAILLLCVQAGLSLSTATAPQQRQTPGLDQLFKASRKEFWGVFAEPADFNNPTYADLIQSQFGLVASKSFSWDLTEPSRGSFNFSSTDPVFTQAIGKPVRAEPLISSSRLPSWIDSTDDPVILTTVIQDHITALWTVVSQALDDEGILRPSIFSRLLGENFIRIAFEAARAADPSAKLYINDNNLDTGTFDSKVAGMINMVLRINRAGKVIEGIGMQARLPAGTDISNSASLQLLSFANVDVIFTDLEVTDALPRGYVTAASACISVRECPGIIPLRDMDGPGGESLALFDSNSSPKPAYTSVLWLFSPR